MIFVYSILAIWAGLILFFLIRFLRKLEHKKGDDKNFLILNQRLDTIANSTNQALRETIQMISNQLKESRETVERSTTAVHQQVQSFTSGITSLAENLKQVQESVRTVSSFQQIFKAPKLRGRWGETSLEAVLAQYFPRDLYKLQHSFKSGEAVDAVVKLPDGRLLPIDSKFPLENFERLVNALDESGQDFYKKAFLTDVKKEIDDISSKYILPSEGTVDLALMYIPAESIYYEIINNLKDVDLASYARSKRVILVSPNTFYLTLSAIQHWFRDAYINKQTREILKKLSRISIDGRKLGEGFKKLGKHLSDARSSYDDNEKRLSLMLDRVEGIMQTTEVVSDKVGEEKVSDDIDKKVKS